MRLVFHPSKFRFPPPHLAGWLRACSVYKGTNQTDIAVKEEVLRVGRLSKINNGWSITGWSMRVSGRRWGFAAQSSAPPSGRGRPYIGRGADVARSISRASMDGSVQRKKITSVSCKRKKEIAAGNEQIRGGPH